MNKKFYLSLFLIFVNLSLAFTQNTDLKRYFDYSKGFEGYAEAIFIGDMAELDEDITEIDILDIFSEKLSDDFESVSKLTKTNTWLLKKH